MIIAKNDEEKRSKIWKIVTLTTTVLIILIAVFFITKLFTANPLEGTWQQEDSDFSFTIQGSGFLTAKWAELLEGSNVRIKMTYSMNKDVKTLTIMADEAQLQKVADHSDGQYTKEGLEAAVSPFTTTFDYSIDKNKLTLTEREYGEQMVFVKK
ncbi:MAG: hypothetical protein RR869_05990 [Lachnospiraceae bacterium]